MTYKVTATVNPGFHIYSYSEVKRPGPVSTSFDFFDKGGLELVGTWSASRDPEKHKDPNFPEVDVVEYYEGEITWSVKLKVPSGLSPGKKTLRSQARYMVCDAKTCSLDGRWALPAVEPTVLVAPDWSRHLGHGPCHRKVRPRSNGCSQATIPRKSSRRCTERAAKPGLESSAVVPPPKAAADSGGAAAVPSDEGTLAAQSEIAQKAPEPGSSFLDRVGDRRAVRARDAVRMADGADHGQLLHQARPGDLGP